MNDQQTHKMDKLLLCLLCLCELDNKKPVISCNQCGCSAHQACASIFFATVPPIDSPELGKYFKFNPINFTFLFYSVGQMVNKNALTQQKTAHQTWSCDFCQSQDDQINALVSCKLCKQPISP
jgi:hypothetical protein